MCAQGTSHFWGGGFFSLVLLLGLVSYFVEKNCRNSVVATCAKLHCQYNFYFFFENLVVISVATLGSTICFPLEKYTVAHTHPQGRDPRGGTPTDLFGVPQIGSVGPPCYRCEERGKGKGVRFKKKGKNPSFFSL